MSLRARDETGWPTAPGVRKGFRAALSLLLPLAVALAGCERPPRQPQRTQRGSDRQDTKPSETSVAEAAEKVGPGPERPKERPKPVPETPTAGNRRRRTVYAWFPRDMNNWDTSAIDFSALTHICFRAVVLQPDGTIKPGWGTTPERVRALVKEAHEHGVKVTVLAWGTNAANSSKYLANCPEKTAKSLLEYVKANDLDGVNIDDETWRETNTETGRSNREPVTHFFRLLRKEFKAAGADYHISYASPPVVSSKDRYGAAWIDYAAVADEIDAFAIMSYCLNPPTIGWTGSAQPVAGGGKVTGHARDYATLVQDYLDATGGRKEKLLLGISNTRGGTEWTCRTERPLSPIVGKPKKLAPEEARANAEEYGRRFDPLQKAPWYRYKRGDRWVQGWYEDDESYGAKLDLVERYDLGGICIWVVDGSKEPPSTFRLIRERLKGR